MAVSGTGPLKFTDDLCLVSTERYGTVQFSTVRFGTGNPHQACVSTANSTLYLIGVVYAGK